MCIRDRVNTTTTLYINVEVTSLDYRDGADRYGFDESQMEMLMEIMRPEYYPLFAEDVYKRQLYCNRACPAIDIRG